MPTAIDESGDTGHTPDSSLYFRLAAAWMPKLEVDSFRDSVRELRLSLGLPIGSCREPGKPMPANAKFRSSKADETLQLVDMICGAAGATIGGNVI